VIDQVGQDAGRGIFDAVDGFAVDDLPFLDAAVHDLEGLGRFDA